MEYKKNKLQVAIEQAHAEGKEPFDFVKFTSFYPHDRGGCERLKVNEPEEVQKNYERMYYLRYPEIKTVEEFAGTLDKIDESY